MIIIFLIRASAYFNSGFRNCFVVTIDGWGDNSSSKIFDFKNGIYNQISSTPTIDSLGTFMEVLPSYLVLNLISMKEKF